MNWTEEQVKLAFHLYCQLPFGKLHSRNPQIIELAALIGRTPGSVAMKCTNLASLDPAIINSGRKGLAGASALDRKVWEEFNSDWERLANECAIELAKLHEKAGLAAEPAEAAVDDVDYTGLTKAAVIKQRVGQNFFRKAVLSAYDNECCMSGVTDSRLLIASHILPWKHDSKNRLNPRNGLCLSALHDRAYDRGLITVTTEHVILISPALQKQKANAFLAKTLIKLEGTTIKLPERFVPDPAFLNYHHTTVFGKISEAKR